jgi:hypothetical protein
MTPLHWQLMLHYYAIAEPYAEQNPGHANSLAVKEYRHELETWGLIKFDPTSGSNYRATERGEFLVDHLTKIPLPLPVQEWRMPSCSISSNKLGSENG